MRFPADPDGSLMAPRLPSRPSPSTPQLSPGRTIRLPSTAASSGRDFDRDLAVVLQILVKVNGRHAARTEFALDGVAIRESGGTSESLYLTAY